MIWQTKCNDCGWTGDASECNGPGLNRCPKCGEDDLEDIEVEEFEYTGPDSKIQVRMDY